MKELSNYEIKVTLTEKEKQKKPFDEQTPEGILPLEKFFEAYAMELNEIYGNPDHSPLSKAHQSIVSNAKFRATHQYRDWVNFSNYSELRRFIQLCTDDINQLFEGKNETEQREILQDQGLNTSFSNLFEPKASKAVLQIFEEKYGAIQSNPFPGFQTNAEEFANMAQAAVVNFEAKRK